MFALSLIVHIRSSRRSPQRKSGTTKMQSCQCPRSCSIPNCEWIPLATGSARSSAPVRMATAPSRISLTWCLCSATLLQRLWRPSTHLEYSVSWLIIYNTLKLYFSYSITKFYSITNLIYEDFDGDDMLGVGDLRQVVDRLTAPQRLNDNDIQQLLQYILDEADLDDDGALSFAEFEHIIEKSSDFSK